MKPYDILIIISLIGLLLLGVWSILFEKTETKGTVIMTFDRCYIGEYEGPCRFENDL